MTDQINMENKIPNEKKKLSVIIPVYGTEKYIDECLVSALKATEGLDAQILVVNDGTKDNAGVIAKRYASEYPDRIFYYEKENGGLADTKNFGMKRASGEFIAFLDSDDYIEPEMYREMLDLAEKEKAWCVVCDMVFDYESTGQKVYFKCISERNTGSIAHSEKSEKGSRDGDEMFRRLVDHTLMASSCNKIMRAELLEGLVFPTGKNNEDIAVTPIAMGRSAKLAYIPKGFYHYMQRSSSIQGGVFSRKRFVIIDVCAMTLERAKELSPERYEILKGAIYVHQVLAAAFSNIRKEPLRRRYPLLRAYMKRVEELFPDFHDNEEVVDSGNWGDSNFANTYRRFCLWLNRKRFYLALSLIWSLFNLVKKE